MWERSALSGSSAGMSRAADDARDAVDALAFKVATDDLWETDPLVDLDETRLGMLPATVRVLTNWVVGVE